MNNVELAKKVLDANSKVLYGFFGFIAGSGYFPPQPFLNEFLMEGNDPCDQDGRMAPWQPFSLSASEYAEVKAWWLAAHPGTVESDLGTRCWQDWTQELLDPSAPQ